MEIKLTVPVSKYGVYAHIKVDYHREEPAEPFSPGAMLSINFEIEGIESIVTPDDIKEYFSSKRHEDFLIYLCEKHVKEAKEQYEIDQGSS